MSRRSTCCFAMSLTRSTESTAIGARICELLLTTLEDSDVVAARMRLSRSSSATGMAMPRRISSAFAAQRRNASAIVVEWIPLPNSFVHASSSAPARTTTEVVPSPASMSCAFDSSTSMRAAGCKTYRSVTSPNADLNLSENRSSIVCNQHLSLFRLNHLIHATGSQTRSNRVGHTYT